MILAVIFILLIFFYSIISRVLDQDVVTGPILFTATGILVSAFLPIPRALFFENERGRTLYYLQL
jgi:hypothetical protein